MLPSLESFRVPKRISEKQKTPVIKPSQRVIDAIFDHLSSQTPNRNTELKYTTDFELLVAAILCTQSTPNEVNALTPALFTRFPDVEDFAAASRADLEISLKSIGFYRQKAKYIQETSRMLLDRFDGAIPDNMVELTQLPGVARKIASLYLAEIYGSAEGIIVETNVHRVANRIGLSAGKSATKVEQDLMKIIPQERWIEVSKLLMNHGRRRCHIQRPSCRHCPLMEVCSSADHFMSQSKPTN